mmetsp:Transcript_19864/g.76118  ORF Transcript_19864/g.76118 Transcript_19864/m.76118 type:complete len:282 (-) Transcript_19864:1984-2829(-)
MAVLAEMVVDEAVQHLQHAVVKVREPHVHPDPQHVEDAQLDRQHHVLLPLCLRHVSCRRLWHLVALHQLLEQCLRSGERGESGDEGLNEAEVVSLLVGELDYELVEGARLDGLLRVVSVKDSPLLASAGLLLLPDVDVLLRSFAVVVVGGLFELGDHALKEELEGGGEPLVGVNEERAKAGILLLPLFLFLALLLELLLQQLLSPASLCSESVLEHRVEELLVLHQLGLDGSDLLNESLLCKTHLSHRVEESILPLLHLLRLALLLPRQYLSVVLSHGLFL